MDSIKNKNNLPNTLPDSYLIESKDKLPRSTCISRRE